MTEFGTSLACLFAAVFFIFCGWYLGPYPDLAIAGYTVPLNGLVKWGCYILAAVLFVFFLGFWGVAMRNAPEMCRFFKAIWGGGEQGWQYASQTMFFVILAFVLHLLVALLFYLSDAVTWLGWLRFVAWGMQLPVMVFAFFAFVLFAYACDAFFIRPILDMTSEGGEKFRTLVDNVRKRGAILLPILVALITLYVEILK